MNKNEKKFTRREVEKVINATLKMIVQDSHYFYSSSIDSKYSNLTPNGEEYLIKIFNEFLPLLQEVEREELDQRAREVVLKDLTKNNHEESK